MRFGAVIVAAGMSTRMKQMKQLMELDHMTLAQRVVSKFQEAGISDIVMVTGYRAGELEHSLKKHGIVFVRNEAYSTTQMFESAKLGFREILGRVDRVFFCPVDVPYFETKTLSLEMTRTERIVYPICHNRIGHPILLDAALLPKILSYEGAGGLKGALDALYSQNTCFLPATDEGAVMDADTPQDLVYLRELSEGREIRPETRVRLTKEKPFFGSGTVTLLREIERQHSVRQACLKAGISYSKGWQIVHIAEESTGVQLVERRAGGSGGGGARLTREGEHLLTLFEELEKNVSDFAKEEFCRIFTAGDLFPKSSREMRQTKEKNA